MLPNKMALQMQNNLPLVANEGQRRTVPYSAYADKPTLRKQPLST